MPSAHSLDVFGMQTRRTLKKTFCRLGSTFSDTMNHRAPFGEWYVTCLDGGALMPSLRYLIVGQAGLQGLPL